MSCPCIRMNNFPTPAFTPRLHDFAFRLSFLVSLPVCLTLSLCLLNHRMHEDGHKHGSRDTFPLLPAYPFRGCPLRGEPGNDSSFSLFASSCSSSRIPIVLLEHCKAIQFGKSIVLRELLLFLWRMLLLVHQFLLPLPHRRFSLSLLSFP